MPWRMMRPKAHPLTSLLATLVATSALATAPASAIAKPLPSPSCRAAHRPSPGPHPRRLGNRPRPKHINAAASSTRTRYGIAPAQALTCSPPHAEGSETGGGNPPDPTGEPAVGGDAPAPALPPSPPAPQRAADFFVSTSGSDEAPGTFEEPVRTVGAALKLAEPGQSIEVGAGTYPLLSDSTRREGPPITIYSEEGAVVEGLSLWGAQGLVFEGLAITSPTVTYALVYIANHPTLKAAQPAEDISLIGDDVSGPGTCVMIRDAAKNVTIEGSHIHNCTLGIASPGNPPAPACNGIEILGNVIEHFSSDAMQFGNWDDVTISGNRIGEVNDPAGIDHNDDIQFTGNSHGIRITGNIIHEPAAHHGQIIFIQPAFGAIDDVLVENNLIFASTPGENGNYPIQSQSATNVRFRYNTIWTPEWRSAILLRAYTGYPPATDTEVVGNILSGYNEFEGATAQVRDYNLMLQKGWNVTEAEAHGLTGVDPLFADPAAGDFSLQSQSPAKEAGDPAAFPPLDLGGRNRAPLPSIGALQ